MFKTIPSALWINKEKTDERQHNSDENNKCVSSDNKQNGVLFVLCDFSRSDFENKLLTSIEFVFTFSAKPGQLKCAVCFGLAVGNQSAQKKSTLPGAGNDPWSARGVDQGSFPWMLGICHQWVTSLSAAFRSFPEDRELLPVSIRLLQYCQEIYLFGRDSGGPGEDRIHWTVLFVLKGYHRGPEIARGQTVWKKFRDLV